MNCVSTHLMAHCGSMMNTTSGKQVAVVFSKKKFLRFLDLRLPVPAPFAEVEFYPRESMRYRSTIQAPKFLRDAREHLAEGDPEVFKVVLLALGAGLRRNEMDKLLWKQINVEKAIIRIEVTVHGRVKNVASEADVPIDDFLCDQLRQFKKHATGEFVIEGATEPKPDASYGKRYRCEAVFKRAILWLKANKVDAAKPIHTLRKEAGSIVNSEEGIHAASRFLRHSDLQVSAAHYVDRRKHVSVGLGKLIADEGSPAKPAN